MAAHSAEHRQRGIVEQSCTRLKHAFVGERTDLVRNAFFIWKPMEGRKEWRDVVSFLLPEDETSSAVLNVLETTVHCRRRQTGEERVAVVDFGQNE